MISSNVTTTTAHAHRTLDWIGSLSSIAIPVYQRDYRWSPETCERFLADIEAIATQDEGRTHFIGSVLTVGDHYSYASGTTLVDGQQRVTTVMLLLAAIAQLAEEDGDPVATDARRLVTRPDMSDEARLRPHERFDDVLTRILCGVDIDVDRPDAATPFEANYAYFLGRMTDNWRQVWLGLQRLEHVGIDLGPGAVAQQVFESLNSTGERLSDDELIHNHVHMGRTHQQQLDLERRVWVPVEEGTRGSVSSFWRDYLVLTSETQPDFSGDFGVYRVFRDRYAEPQRDVTQAIEEEWIRLAAAYGALVDPTLEEDAELRRQLRFLQTFGSAPRPFVLGRYDAYRAGRVELTTIREELELVQSLFMRRSLVNLESAIGLSGALCRDVRQGTDPVKALVSRTPEDPQVRLALTHAKLPHRDYVLRRLQTPPAGVSDLQVEHIYPQTPLDRWTGTGERTWGDLNIDEQAEYRTVLDTIGNLTLLESHLNQGASNRSFADKAQYYEKSAIEETRGLAQRDGWDVSRIRDRTELLAGRFLKTWQRPRGVAMTDSSDLVRLVDLAPAAVRGYPNLYEYVEFEGQLWGDVHTSKELLVRLAEVLWKRDQQRLRDAKYGSILVEERSKGQRYLRVPGGPWLYVGWSSRWLATVAHEWVATFDLEDAVRVRELEDVATDSEPLGPG